MKKICIVYRSLTGNTEKIAGLLSDSLTDYEVDILEMEGLDPSSLLPYNGILLGAFTWGNGVLHYDANVFFRKLSRIDLSGKAVGCFGSGDRSFTHFCAAVDLFQEKAIELGANVMPHGLKIHCCPDSQKDIEKCELFAEGFKSLLEQRSLVPSYNSNFPV
ncbi:MAG: flavodoxin domain-containing protein [Bacillota bacterium]